MRGSEVQESRFLQLRDGESPKKLSVIRAEEAHIISLLLMP